MAKCVGTAALHVMAMWVDPNVGCSPAPDLLAGI